MAGVKIMVKEIFEKFKKITGNDFDIKREEIFGELEELADTDFYLIGEENNLINRFKILVDQDTKELPYEKKRTYRGKLLGLLESEIERLNHCHKNIIGSGLTADSTNRKKQLFSEFHTWLESLNFASLKREKKKNTSKQKKGKKKKNNEIEKPTYPQLALYIYIMQEADILERFGQTKNKTDEIKEITKKWGLPSPKKLELEFNKLTKIYKDDKRSFTRNRLKNLNKVLEMVEGHKKAKILVYKAIEIEQKKN